MTTTTSTGMALLAALCLAAAGGAARGEQQGWRGGGNQGHFPGGPPHGPAPVRAAPPPQAPGHQPPPRPPQGEGWRGQPPPSVQRERPHVERDARWVGHESGPHDVHYRVERPWAHGHFRRPIGAGHVYRINGWDPARRRFWFASSYFVVAEPDWAYASDWDWANDQVVLYLDPDHPGWYLAYNVRLGTYVHVEYDGGM